MDLVVDANVIFAALIKEGTSYELLFEEQFNFSTPDYILSEFEEHKEEILKKTGKTKEEMQILLDVLKRNIKIFQLEELVPYLKDAEEISPDPDDVAYIALALKLKCPIWSNDKSLKQKQDAVEVYSTDELMKRINLK